MAIDPLQYVTLTEAKAHLRVDHAYDDADIELKIYAASAAVKNYMKTASVYEPERDEDEDPILDSDGFPEIAVDSDSDKQVRREVKIAVLLLLSEWFMHRGTAQEGQAQFGQLPDSVIALLYPLRDPACQ